MVFDIVNNGRCTVIAVDERCPEGVKIIASVVADDILAVTGIKPEVIEVKSSFEFCNRDSVIYVSAETPDAITGKRECFMLEVSELVQGRHICRVLTVSGSEKRGSIYGLFKISELCGVSPLVWWGDVKPAHRGCVSVELNGSMTGNCAPEDYKDCYISREPSVRYRGFFINDEWPAFGRWSEEKFGGFTKEVYEQVFIFLLRMKGNYLWPAMWSSTFSEDGPGIASAELADKLGVVMGTSHHEPLCRAGSEWQNIYAQYGRDNTWSFVSNREAITDFWRDGVIRNRNFENVYTIGMRGECDSKLLGEDATLADNICVIKDAILTQNRLLRENVSENLKDIPRMLAIYKEVEDYYYGDSTCEGLREWDELKDVIFLLSDDNHGNLRGLPEERDRATHTGGYGMYYHFDYHGAPISYEWVNCVSLYKTREQMSMAWDYGVRDLWIVNVGDLKGNEYPLSFFMELAYDYDRWCGITAPKDYSNYFFEQSFGGRIRREQLGQIEEFVEGFTRWNLIRKPEHMNPRVFAPFAFGEGEFVLQSVCHIIDLGNQLMTELPDDVRSGFESMFGYAGIASMNLIAMHVEAAQNAFYASRGNLRANVLADSVKHRIDVDKQLVYGFHRILGGKWNHMMDSAHTGFMTWNDEKWAYPEVSYVAEEKSDAEDICEEVTEETQIIVIEAGDYENNVTDAEGRGWEIVPGLGRLEDAIKSGASLVTFAAGENAPYAEYDFELDSEGDYNIELTFIARNPVVKGAPMRCSLSVNGAEPVTVNTVGSDYYTEWMCPEWSSSVMTGVRHVDLSATLRKGLNRIKLYPGDPNVIFERFVISPAELELPKTYLGPGRG